MKGVKPAQRLILSCPIKGAGDVKNGRLIRLVMGMVRNLKESSLRFWLADKAFKSHQK